jgi:cell division protein FtsW
MKSQPSTASAAISISAAALMGIGVVMVFSASATLGEGLIDQRLTSSSEIRQATIAFAALIIMLMVGLCPYESWRIRPQSAVQPTLAFALISIALLVLVLIPGIGEVRNGARRWMSLGPAGAGLGFQPSELAKVSLVLLLAGLAARLGPGIRSFWTGFLPLASVGAIFAALVGVEDFGTAALLAAVAGCILLGAGAKFWHLAIVSLPGVAGLAYLIIDKPYRVQRLTAFLDPFADAQGSGYHQVQSLITIASGGWWGRGLGAGVQKYGYLPEARSDFIYAVICEELGLAGGIAVLGLFAVMLWTGRRAMVGAGSEFGRLLALGVSLTIGFQATMNVAVVTVSVPTKGIGLPLVSAGGTGVLLYGFMLGLLINVARIRHGSRRIGYRSPAAATVAPPRTPPASGPEFALPMT